MRINIFRPTGPSQRGASAPWVLAALLAAGSLLGQSAGANEKPAPWDGPVLNQPRTHLTVDQLSGDALLPLLDMSFFAAPDRAEEALPFSGTVSIAAAEMDFPKDREPYSGEDLFPAFAVEFLSDGSDLIPARRDLISTGGESDSRWNVIIGAGKIWREQGDGGLSRASFPLSLMDRVYGPIRNCVGTFVYDAISMSNVYVQCSQETANLGQQQVGNTRVMAPAAYAPTLFPDAAARLNAYERSVAKRLPVAPLSEIDGDGRIAEFFNRSIYTSASTSAGAIFLDGMLYVNTPRTRHGLYPYPDEMRHAVFSVTKSVAGALAMFYFAERYGEEIFDAQITDYVPVLSDRPEWRGVTFFHVLNMVTGTRGGEGEDVFVAPLLRAKSSDEAIENIAALGDAPGEPGEVFHYAATHTFVLSYALQKYVEEREGAGVRYWDLVSENVLAPIGAEDLPVLTTRDADPSTRTPLLTVGASPTLDEVAKVALLFAAEGEFDGRQLLNRTKLREAFARTEWSGYATNRETRVKAGERYRHSFRTAFVRVGFCRVKTVYMLGYGGNYVMILPSGAVIFRFMDELDYNLDPLVRRVEQVRSSC